MASSGLALLLISVNVLGAFAFPAQMFSPGIPITPTVIQNPGQISGIVTDKEGVNVATRFSTSSPPAFPVQNNFGTPVMVVAQPNAGTVPQANVSPQPSLVYINSNRPYYTAPQYTGQNPSAYIYPNGEIVRPRPGVAPYGGPISQLINNAIGDSTNWNRLGSPQTVGTLATLGTLGTIGALGTLGAGALLLG
ncbi:uncharacterized protein LOC131689917 [Topomyia yanbarensis]|uniref:uncharacterized protein LOC131689917 n=1 Tax=Topomyia yanbarensis TaxID=2498891 RepID=UPI00273C7740|nr:uncharacterized protein LOC131689917 [Topomyia yanbarensis]